MNPHVEICESAGRAGYGSTTEGRQAQPKPQFISIVKGPKWARQRLTRHLERNVAGASISRTLNSGFYYSSAESSRTLRQIYLVDPLRQVGLDAKEFKIKYDYREPHYSQQFHLQLYGNPIIFYRSIFEVLYV